MACKFRQEGHSHTLPLHTLAIPQRCKMKTKCGLITGIDLLSAKPMAQPGGGAQLTPTTAVSINLWGALYLGDKIKARVSNLV